MPKSEIETILNEAKTEERKYNWLGAVDCYTKLRSLSPIKRPLDLARIFEYKGYAYYRFSMQSGNNAEFRARSRLAIENYENAIQCYLRSKEHSQRPEILRSRAMIAFVNYWLASGAAKKKACIDECWRLTKKALSTFENLDTSLEYIITYNQLVDSAFFAFFLEWNFHSREMIVKEAIKLGEQTIVLLSKCERSVDVHERAKTYAKNMVCITVFAYNFLDVSDRDREYVEANALWSKAKKLNEEIAVQEILHPFFGPNIFYGVEGTEEAIDNFSTALRFARKTKDKFLLGSAFDWLTYHTAWSTRKTDEYDKQLEFSERAMGYAKKAEKAFSSIGFTSPRDDLAWIGDASEFGCFASIVIGETNLRKKRKMLDQMLKAAPHMMKKAVDSGYPEITSYANHMYSFMLTSLSQLETSKEERKITLDKALEHRIESLRIVSQVQPYMYWNLGVNYQLLAAVRSELADLTDNMEMKKKIINEAISDSDASLKFRNRDLVFYRSKGSTEALIAQIAEDQFLYGRLLTQLYNFAGKEIDLKKALQSYRNSLAGYKELGLTSRMAECYWTMAKTYDRVADHRRSAENFRLASISYREAMEKIPQLKEFYEEQSIYMQAWSEIEKARENHRQQKYGSAKKNFEKAAELHQSLKQWSYLEPNYLAWVLVEHGEELSRKDKSDEALRAFEHAAGMFIETENSIKAHLPSIQDLEERKMATNVLRGSYIRQHYCLARARLEEARLLDKKGDHLASSGMYGMAVRLLERVDTELEFEHDKRELRFLILVAQAWEKMMRAEAEASPNLYREAGACFESASKLSLNEKSGMLVLGHSQMCRALEAGLKLTNSMNRTTYDAAKRYLKNAANYYQKAGFQEATEYAKATELLFDAHWIIGSAKEEHNPDKRARFCVEVEKLLQSSAGAFERARHVEKQEQVAELEKKVGELRELETSLGPLLSASRIASSRNVFTVPTPTYEEPVGLERFENAEIRATLNVRNRQLAIGESVALEIEIVNAGRAYALLTKIKNAIPEGFELVGRPKYMRVDDGSLNLNGRKLYSLDTEEIRLFLKPKVEGNFTVEPEIFYLGEDGKYRSHIAEPVRLIVRELSPEATSSQNNLVETGSEQLDRLLYGGLVPNSAVVLTSALTDQRVSLVSDFIKTGLEKKQITFYITRKASELTEFAEKNQTCLFVFICNSQVSEEVGDTANIFKLKDIENLTEISIAINTALNELSMPPDSLRRACIEIVSDVLLQHEALKTRRWLYSLIPQLRSKGFTVLATIDPEMHLSKDVHAVLDIFDGEISIYEKETSKGPKKFVRIVRMQNQEYLEGEHPLPEDTRSL